MLRFAIVFVATLNIFKRKQTSLWPKLCTSHQNNRKISKVRMELFFFIYVVIGHLKASPMNGSCIKINNTGNVKWVTGRNEPLDNHLTAGFTANLAVFQFILSTIHISFVFVCSKQLFSVGKKLL